jgi:catechol 2,3-dioxygenase-like lactoylglutathione lyase family enzyme
LIGYPAAARNREHAMQPIDRILETVIYAEDLEEAERFYGTVLGLEVDSRKDGLFVFLRCGEAMLLVFDPRASIEGRQVPGHGTTGPGHVCFAVPEAELDGWKAHLEACGIAIETETPWPRGGRSFYFRDPAGNSVELATPRIWGFEDVPGGG